MLLTIYYCITNCPKCRCLKQQIFPSVSVNQESSNCWLVMAQYPSWGCNWDESWGSGHIRTYGEATSKLTCVLLCTLRYPLPRSLHGWQPALVSGYVGLSVLLMWPLSPKGCLMTWQLASEQERETERIQDEVILPLWVPIKPSMSSPDIWTSPAEIPRIIEQRQIIIVPVMP